MPNQMLQLHNHSDYDYFIRNCDWYLQRNFYHLCCFYYTDKYTHTILQYINILIVHQIHTNTKLIFLGRNKITIQQSF